MGDGECNSLPKKVKMNNYAKIINNIFININCGVLTLTPLIGISWSNLLLSAFIIVLLVYVGIKIVRFILK